MCPSRASRAIVATVSPTAMRFAHAPRPKRHTAANPTTTRNKVTLFGVHRILTCQLRHATKPCNRNLCANPCSCKTHLFNHLQRASPLPWPLHASQIHHLSLIRAFSACFLSSASASNGLSSYLPLAHPSFAMSLQSGVIRVADGTFRRCRRRPRPRHEHV